MRDVNAQVLAMLLGLRAPDFAQDVAMREYTSWMFHESAAQSVLGGGQFDFTACARDHMRGKIDDQVAILEYRHFLGRPRLTLRGAQSCEQFRSTKWLGNVIVRAVIERSYFFLHIVTHRQHDDWHFAPFPQTF